MLSNNEDGLHCRNRCLSLEHGERITSALTQCGLSDAELCCYLNYVCDLCGTSKDYDHRTALHIAASCGYTEVCKWLICQKHSQIDEIDSESGYTALHRSVFYGKIDTAVAIIRLGAKLNILDFNNWTPLDHAMKDNPLRAWNFLVPRWIYMWGTNFNYTLGSSESKHNPELIDIFHKLNPKSVIKKVCLEKYHTAILTDAGEVYTYGHGQGGRLGLGSEVSNLEPTKIKFNAKHEKVIIKDVCIGRDHSIFLADNNAVWTCGSNKNFVLGVQPMVAKLLTPRPLTNFKKPHICCGPYHSVAWSANGLYTWGLNAGQLGFNRNNEIHQIVPKRVTYVMGDWLLKDVVASSGATAVLTDQGDIFVLNEFQCRKIASKVLDIEKIRIVGGKLSFEKSANVELKIVAITSTGNIFIWRESDPYLDRAIFSLNRTLQIKDVALNIKSMVLLTHDRELFKAFPETRKKGKNRDKTKSKTFHKFLDRNECILMNLERIPKIFAADTIVSDLEGDNFATLQMNVLSYITRVPNISNSTFQEDMQNLITHQETSDFTFIINGSRFPVHKYIIGLGSAILKKMVTDCIEAKINTVNPKIFEELLKYLYTNDCDLLHEGPYCISVQTDSTKIENIDKNVDTKVDTYNPLKLLQETAKKLALNELYNEIYKFTYKKGNIEYKSDKYFTPKILKFKIENLQHLQDVHIECNGRLVLSAHKCILAARCEFFRNMFSIRWNDKLNSKLALPFPRSTVKRLLCYLYTDHICLDNEDLESVCNLLILAEYILMERLMEICEFTLSKMLTFKNVFTIISLAHMYNAEQLKNCCMEFICLNLAATLEGRFLEELDIDILRDLTKFYSTWNRYMAYRVITPYSDNVNNDILKELSKSHPVNMNFNEDIVSTPKLPHRKRNRSHKTCIVKKKEAKNETMIMDSVIIQSSIEEPEGKETSPPPGRITAIASAMEHITIQETGQDNFVLLNKEKFPALNTSFSNLDNGHNMKSRYRTDKQKMQKISQKVRKRLPSETSTKAISESPKKTWKVIESISTIGSPTAKTNISSIITEEKKQKENLLKIKSKLLFYTQLEDKAMEDLHRFYNVDNISDEIIETDRVEIGLVAAPVWVQK